MRLRLLIFFFLFGYVTLGQNYAPHGEVFTPRGDLRTLIIFAGFEEYDYPNQFKNWEPGMELPWYIKDGHFPEAFYASFDEFAKYKDDTTVVNLSKLYHEMSSPLDSFRLVADVYPRRIDITTEGLHRGKCWGKFNKRVLEKMREQDPDFDWSPYDNRKNQPNFLFDNSLTSPDGKPDYVIICYLYNPKELKKTLPSVYGCLGDGGGGSTLWGLSNFQYNGYTLGSDGFYVGGHVSESPDGFFELFKHELGHELFSGPHYMGANGAMGEYFYVPATGWGSVVTNETLNQSINAWERWVCGWIDIKHDLDGFEDNGTYELRDFITTGDAIRIKIPHTQDQYLWIENHQKKSVFDKSIWKGKLKNKPKGSEGIADSEPGLYLFVEAILSDREKITKYLVNDMSKVNGVRVLHAEGNFDYETPTAFTKTTDWSEYWNNKMYHFERGEANPYAGVNPYLMFRADWNQDGRIDNKGNFNYGLTESMKIVKERVNDTLRLMYSNHGGRNEESRKYRRSDAFQVGDELGLATNPPVTNNPKYNKRVHALGPMHLNGIHISVVSQDKEGAMRLKIAFDRTDVDQDVRLTGNLRIHDVPNTVYDLDVQRGVTVLVNRSGVPNRLKKSKDYGFVNPTVVKMTEGADARFGVKSKLRMEDQAILQLNSGATCVFDKRSALELDGESTLRLDSGSTVELLPWSRIKVSPEAKIVFEEGAVVDGTVLTGEVVITGASLRRRQLWRKLE